ncbi:hypothetical protein DFH06DRAFT_1134599 [Mycena polygramma]|nr:hypothetical protein DFH06DRAFT_1134599 [Mycena polygramma]
MPAADRSCLLLTVHAQPVTIAGNEYTAAGYKPNAEPRPRFPNTGDSGDETTVRRAAYTHRFGMEEWRVGEKICRDVDAGDGGGTDTGWCKQSRSVREEIQQPKEKGRRPPEVGTLQCLPRQGPSSKESEDSKREIQSCMRDHRWWFRRIE